MSCGMPKSSFFLWCCPNPLNFDTYEGCGHQCSYCFVNFRSPSAAGSFKNIKRGSTAASLRKWIEGGRGAREAWVAPDWKIPICWGRNSDPFQPMERETGWSLECLKVLAETKYPFVVTTKSTLIAEEPYRSLFAKCNCVIQISMVCSAYDRLEKGAPCYEDRLKAAATMASLGLRVIARWQPFFIEPWIKSASAEFTRLKEAGVYGVLCEAAKLSKPIGNCRYGTKHAKLYSYPNEAINVVFGKVREKCHENGLVFLCGDNQRLSDSLECCGTEGMGWAPNLCTVTRRYLKPETYAVRDCQKVAGTGCAFKNCHTQSCKDLSFMRKSFAENIEEMFTPNYESVVKTGMSLATRKASLARKEVKKS